MLKILDLFAGAGGLSLGFEKTGQFEVAAIVENNKNAAKTYLRNHPGLKNYEDILTVDFQQIKTMRRNRCYYRWTAISRIFLTQTDNDDS